jgi:hypothetical protein
LGKPLKNADSATHRGTWGELEAAKAPACRAFDIATSIVVTARQAKRGQITAPLQVVLLAATAWLRHIGLSPLLILLAGRLYPRNSTCATSISDVEAW